MNDWGRFGWISFINRFLCCFKCDATCLNIINKLIKNCFITSRPGFKIARHISFVEARCRRGVAPRAARARGRSPLGIVPEMTRERRRVRRVTAFTKGSQMRVPEDFNEATTLCDFIACSVMRNNQARPLWLHGREQLSEMLQVTLTPHPYNATWSTQMTTSRRILKADL